MGIWIVHCRNKMLLFLLCCFLLGTVPSVRAAEGNIIVFVSFSMPKESLKALAQSAKAVHAPLVIRGLVHNSFKETVHAVYELVQGASGGVQVDPLLFKKFNVQKVPALVVTSGNDYDIVYGNVPLDYSLRAIVKEEDSLSPVASAALGKLERAGHA